MADQQSSMPTLDLTGVPGLQTPPDAGGRPSSAPPSIDSLNLDLTGVTGLGGAPSKPAGLGAKKEWSDYLRKNQGPVESWASGLTTLNPATLQAATPKLWSWFEGQAQSSLAGWQRAAEGFKRLWAGEARIEPKTERQPGEPVLQGASSTKFPRLQAAADVMGGAMQGAAPFVLPAAAIANPVGTAIGVGTGMAAHTAITKSGEALGADPGFTEFAAEVGALAAGGVAERSAARWKWENYVGRRQNWDGDLGAMSPEQRQALLAARQRVNEATEEVEFKSARYRNVEKARREIEVARQEARDTGLDAMPLSVLTMPGMGRPKLDTDGVPGLPLEPTAAEAVPSRPRDVRIVTPEKSDFSLVQAETDAGPAAFIVPRGTIEASAPTDVGGVGAVPSDLTGYFSTLLKDARDNGFRGSDDDLANMFLQAVQEARRIKDDLGAEGERGTSPRELLKAIADAGGIGIEAEGRGGMVGEVERLLQAVNRQGGGFRVVKRGPRAGTEVRVPKEFAQAGGGRIGLPNLIRRKGGLSLDAVREALNEDPRWAGQFDNLGDLVDAIDEAIAVEAGVIRAKPHQVSDIRGILENGLDVREGTPWWQGPEHDAVAGMLSEARGAADPIHTTLGVLETRPDDAIPVQQSLRKMVDDPAFGELDPQVQASIRARLDYLNRHLPLWKARDWEVQGRPGFAVNARANVQLDAANPVATEILPEPGSIGGQVPLSRVPDAVLDRMDTLQFDEFGRASLAQFTPEEIKAMDEVGMIEGAPELGQSQYVAREWLEVARDVRDAEIEALEREGMASFARTESGGVRVGVNEKAIAPILGSSLYSREAGPIIVKELIQNAFDAIRGVMRGRVEVKVKDDVISVSDNGPGMTPEQLQTVFTDLASSGKRDDASASGGFGLAKASFLLGGRRAIVSTVVQEGSTSSWMGLGSKPNKVRYSFEGTPQQLMEGVSIAREEVSPDTPTGTQVTTIIDPKVHGSAYWIERQARMMFKYSSWPEGSEVVMNGVPVKSQPWTPRHDLTFDIPGATVEIQLGAPDRFPKSSVSFGVNNNDLYQFDHSAGGSRAFVRVPGLPEEGRIIIRATVPEGDPLYPFTANREQLRSQALDVIRNEIAERVIDPIVTAHLDAITKQFTSGKSLRVGNEDVAVVDPHNVAGSVDWSSPRVGALVQAVLGATRDLAEDLTGSPIDALGLYLGKNAHGVNFKSGDAIEGIYFNPVSWMGGKQNFRPDQVAAGLMHTVIHELTHRAERGHDESFTVALSQAYAKAGRSALSLQMGLEKVLSPDGKTFYPELVELSTRLSNAIASVREADPDYSVLSKSKRSIDDAYSSQERQSVDYPSGDVATFSRADDAEAGRAGLRAGRDSEHSNRQPDLAGSEAAGGSRAPGRPEGAREAGQRVRRPAVGNEPDLEQIARARQIFRRGEQDWQFGRDRYTPLEPASGGPEWTGPGVPDPKNPAPLPLMRDVRGIWAIVGPVEQVLWDIPEARKSIDILLKGADEEPIFVAKYTRRLFDTYRDLGKAQQLQFSDVLDNFERPMDALGQKSKRLGVEYDVEAVRAAARARDVLNEIYALFPGNATAQGTLPNFIKGYFTHIQRETEHVPGLWAGIEQLADRWYGQMGRDWRELFQRKTVPVKEGGPNAPTGKGNKTPKSPYVEERTGALADIEMDPSVVFPIYVKSAARVIIDKNIVLEAQKAINEMPRSKARDLAQQVLNNYTQYDALPELHRAWKAMTRGAAQVVVRSYLGLSPRLFLLHLARIQGVYAEMPNRYFWRHGIAQTLRHPRESFERTAEAGLMPNHLLPSAYRDYSNKLDNLLSLMSASDFIDRSVGLYGFEKMYLDQGYDPATAFRMAVRQTKKSVQFTDRVRYTFPSAQGNPLAHELFRFKAIPVRILWGMAETMQNARRDPKRALRHAGVVAALYGIEQATHKHLIHVGSDILKMEYIAAKEAYEVLHDLGQGEYERAFWRFFRLAVPAGNSVRTTWNQLEPQTRRYLRHLFGFGPDGLTAPPEDSGEGAKQQ